MRLEVGVRREEGSQGWSSEFNREWVSDVVTSPH